MKRLSFVPDDLQVEGNVIEYSDHKYRMKNYYYRFDDDYDENEKLSQELTDDEQYDVIRQNTFEDRVKRLHNYFRAADYISYSALYQLNFDDEEYVYALRKVVNF